MDEDMIKETYYEVQYTCKECGYLVEEGGLESHIKFCLGEDELK